MSRIGKKPIKIPSGTEVTISDNVINVKGPVGTLSLAYNPIVEIKVEDGEIVLTPKNTKIETRALWGTYGSRLVSMVSGVNKEYAKVLKIEGVGYKAEMRSPELMVMALGFSHPVEMKVPEGLKCIVEKDTVTISGVDKEAVGQFAAKVRSQKKPEPYKGKGIRYVDEIIRRKEGKKAL